MKLDEPFGIYEQTLKLRARRSEVLAANLANADTPGYKARDFDFRNLLQQQTPAVVRLAATHGAHFQVTPDASSLGGLLQYRIPHQASLDGNTVEAESEQARFSANAVRFQASLRFLDGRIKNLMTALKGE